MVAFGGILLLSTALLGHLPGVFPHQQPCEKPCVPGTEEIMKQKAHGTSETPVQENLRFDCDWKTADRICNYNRRYAEYSGYWKKTSFLKQAEKLKDGEKMTFYDSNTGKPLFTAPKDRTWSAWIKESTHHGWPSFRDSEVNWDFVRVLPDGETVSVDGTHLVSNFLSFSCIFFFFL